MAEELDDYGQTLPLRLTERKGFSARFARCCRHERELMIFFMKLLAIVFVLQACLHASADWTIDLPQPPGSVSYNPGYNATVHGYILQLGPEPPFDATAAKNRIVWISPTGELLLYAKLTNASFGKYAILNPRQCVATVSTFDPESRTTKTAIRLFTRQPDASVSSQDFGNIDGTAYWLPSAPIDDSGIYAVDTANWKLRRIDFPKPGSVTDGFLITLQSSSASTGPWTRLQDFVMPRIGEKRFFRLEIRQLSESSASFAENAR